MNNPFRASREQPQTDIEKKWYVTGGFSLLTLIASLLPVVVIIYAFNDTVVLTWQYNACFISILVYMLSWWFTTDYWSNLGHNLGLAIYYSNQKTKTNHDSITNEEKKVE